jgi:hypothetical protein
MGFSSLSQHRPSAISAPARDEPFVRKDGHRDARKRFSACTKIFCTRDVRPRAEANSSSKTRESVIGDSQNAGVPRRRQGPCAHILSADFKESRTPFARDELSTNVFACVDQRWHPAR